MRCSCELPPTVCRCKALCFGCEEGRGQDSHSPPPPCQHTCRTPIPLKGVRKRGGGSAAQNLTGDYEGEGNMKNMKQEGGAYSHLHTYTCTGWDCFREWIWNRTSDEHTKVKYCWILMKFSPNIHIDIWIVFLQKNRHQLRWPSWGRARTTWRPSPFYSLGMLSKTSMILLKKNCFML